ncbi:MAG: hypothetical protein L3K26_00825 [Candidatus Hydrogenedentes bacterium]|nr:hypothetical protein [Candidatus Hydrogenedentota bacterium]
MPTYTLPYRITSFLERQIAWLECALKELDAMGWATDDELDALVIRQSQREQEAQNMAREYNGLSHEWQQTEAIEKDGRDSIRLLSQQAQELSETLRIRYGEAQRIADKRAQKKRNALDDLRRERRSVTIYRPEMIVSPGFIDKKA